MDMRFIRLIPRIEESMGYSDIVILAALKRLQAEHGEDAIISYSMIANEAPASIKTVIRAMKRLQARQQVEAHFTVGTGYRYRILHDLATTRD